MKEPEIDESLLVIVQSRLHSGPGYGFCEEQFTECVGEIVFATAEAEVFALGGSESPFMVFNANGFQERKGKHTGQYEAYDPDPAESFSSRSRHGGILLWNARQKVERQICYRF